MTTTIIDPIKTALGVFVLLGVVLTGVAGYALVSTVGSPVALSPGLAVALLSGGSLVAFVLVASKLLQRRTHRRTA